MTEPEPTEPLSPVENDNDVKENELTKEEEEEEVKDEEENQIEEESSGSVSPSLPATEENEAEEAQGYQVDSQADFSIHGLKSLSVEDSVNSGALDQKPPARQTLPLEEEAAADLQVHDEIVARTDEKESESKIQEEGENIVLTASNFVNHGLAQWEKNRQQWLTLNRSDTDSSAKPAATPLDVDEIIDVIFASPRQWRDAGGPQKFPQPVPLPQMVDILQDLWEAEGLET